MNMKTIQEVLEPKAILEREIYLLISNFERENQVEISSIIIDRVIIETEWGRPLENILEVKATIEL